MNNIVEIIKYLSLSFFITFLISYLFAPIYIKILYILKFQQKGKVEVDTELKSRKLTIGTPVMGGLIVVIPVIFFLIILILLLNNIEIIRDSFLYKYIEFISYRRMIINALFYLIIIMLGGSIIGFLSDYLDLFGKTQRKYGYIYTNYNKIVYHNYFTWWLIRAATLPIRLISKPIDSVASYKTGISPSLKLFLEIILVTTVLLLNDYSTSIWVPIFNIELSISFLLLTVFHVIVVTGFSVAFSWTDGLDGISPGNHMIAFIFAGILSIISGNYILAIISFAIAGAELTFYYFNLPPARVEMSDIGTIPLGFVFALIFIMINKTLLLPIVGFVFFVEIISSIAQAISVKFFKKKILLMAPLHHHFEKLGWSKEKIVMRSYFVSIVMGVISIILSII